MAKFKYTYAGNEKFDPTQVSYIGRAQHKTTQSTYRAEFKRRKHLWGMENVKIYSEKSRVVKGFESDKALVRGMTYEESVFDPNTGEYERKSRTGWVVSEAQHKLGIVTEEDVSNVLENLERASGNDGLGENELGDIWEGLDAKAKAEVVSQIAYGIGDYSWEEIFRQIYPGQKTGGLAGASREQTEAEDFRNQALEILQKAEAHQERRETLASRFKQ